MEQNFHSGEEYANALIKDMAKLDRDFAFGPPLDRRLMELWLENIRKFADQTYLEYILGTRDNYMFSDVEFQELFDKSSLQYTEEIVGDLVDKGALKMNVDNEGEITYSLTEEGKKLNK